MTAVTCSETRCGSLTCLRMTVSGHAGYAPKGQDIVCAAVSILVHGLSLALQRLEQQNTALRVTRRKSGEGYAELEVQLLPQALAEGKAAFAVALGGFALLADSYPQCVTIQINNVTNWNIDARKYDE